MTSNVAIRYRTNIRSSSRKKRISTKKNSRNKKYSGRKKISRKSSRRKNIQSIIFSKDEFTLKEAKQYLKDHGYSHIKVDIKPNTYRFRQIDPSKFTRFFTKKVAKGISYLIGIF